METLIDSLDRPTTDLVSQVAMRVEVQYGGCELLEGLADEWSALWDLSVTRDPFTRPEWAIAHVRAFEKGAALQVLTVRHDNRLVLVLPLVREMGLFYGIPVRRLRPASNFHSLRYDIVRVRGPVGEEALRLMWQSLRSRRDWDVIVFSKLPALGSGGQLIKLAQESGNRVILEPNRSLIIPFDHEGSCDPPWQATVSRSLRKDLRQVRKKVEAEFHVPVAVVSTVAAEAASLREFFDLEKSGWKGRDGTAIACRPDTLQFYTEIAQAFARLGFLNMHFLRFGQTISAGVFDLTCNAITHGLKMAYCEEFARFSPGHLILDEVAHKSWDAGSTEFNLGPDNAYKRRWTSLTHEMVDCSILTASVYGRLLNHYKTTLRPAVRRLLLRLGIPVGRPESSPRD